ncbi:hypothetical protein AMK21_14485 [Streptomyces sp. CB00316]|uniref:hypothetical protein n=1 Tax=unclassified Streptomyces TaxID=2593676 RepID=UPI00093E8613|nr:MULTISPECIES: hypothetical protein [unclassified Streptomyces]MBT2377955.1 hypothetical protein [Streptomyces sp. ISL-111]MBT2428869.1 hypothetical protein [Streptomyces sp. ISL-112]MBT2461285.1 hypothetical protein [Streptomyces sp. ISL-63]OKJ19570.1 hypothetical protein AMK21_14485 [Streptomyces sp. CB00316]
MTARAGEPFELLRAVAEAEQLLATPVLPAGPTTAQGDPATGEWTATEGAGFRIVPLWEGDPLTGVYAPEWSDAEEAADAHLSALAQELDRRWGPHRTIRLHGPLREWQAGALVEPLFQALFAEDLYGDLTVWDPALPDGRWAALTVGHSDGDAPLVLAALVGDRAVARQ